MNQKKIGVFITEKRKDKNLTRDNLAELLGVTTRTIINWETGKCMPDYSVLISLCDVLNITVDELINGENKQTSAYSIELIIEYLDRNRENNLKQKQFFGKIFLIGGILVTTFIMFFIPTEYIYIKIPDPNIFVYLGAVLVITGFCLINNKYVLKKRMILNIIFTFLFILFLIAQDTLNIIINNQPPRFYISAINEHTSEAYQTLFYDVYRCLNQDNKYHFVSKKNSIFISETEHISPSYYYCDEEVPTIKNLK